MTDSLFEALITAVRESTKAADSVKNAVTNLRTKWSMADQGCSRGEGVLFETWVLQTIDETIWLQAMDILYNTDKTITNREAIITIARSLHIPPCQLYSTIGDQVLSSRRGLQYLREIINLFEGKLKPII